MSVRPDCTLHSAPGRYDGKVYEAMWMLGLEENPLSSVVNLTSDVLSAKKNEHYQLPEVGRVGGDLANSIFSLMANQRNTGVPITMDNAVIDRAVEGQLFYKTGDE
ncbi:8209_t:CDS:2 [Paraglomus occultum]|uniref:8209_t:CDS:1 n=1 Tax=Paraglomus occultum TaxID=144539 RepID=A0A9N9C502_9GLOM|nr:8209_t:CDS:2 [Paraglomus occultum]